MLKIILWKQFLCHSLCAFPLCFPAVPFSLCFPAVPFRRAFPPCFPASRPKSPFHSHMNSFLDANTKKSRLVVDDSLERQNVASLDRGQASSVDGNHDMEAPDQKSQKIDLGLVRTDLANERTLLAYGRTSLMVLGTGASMIQFLSDSKPILILGWITAVAGVLIGVIGIMRFSRLRKRLHS